MNNLTRLYSVKLQSINQAEYLRMDIGRKQIVLHVEKCIFTAKNLYLIDFLRQRIWTLLYIFSVWGGGYFKYVLYEGGGCLGDDLVIMSWQSD